MSATDTVAGAGAGEMAQRLWEIRAEVSAALAAAGSGGVAREAVTIVGASKYQPVDAVVAAYDAGLRDFGENYAGELRDKRAAFQERRPQAHDVRWHFIGKVQRGNAKLIASADLVHGVGSASQADAVGAARRDALNPLDVLIQVNVADEDHKNGVALVDVSALVDHVRALPTLRLRGLMTMPVFADDTGAGSDGSDARLFAAFAAVAGAAKDHGLDVVSMGMSGDFPLAIAAGATMIRVGTRLFGPRPAP